MVGKVKKLLSLNMIRRYRNDVSTCYKSASGSRCYCGGNMDHNSTYQKIYGGKKIVNHTIAQPICVWMCPDSNNQSPGTSSL